MPNREIRDERQTDDGRPKVGPADPETRRRLLNERLAEREPAIYGNQPRQKRESKQEAPPKKEPSPTSDLSVFNVARKLRAARARREEEAGNP